MIKIFDIKIGLQNECKGRGQILENLIYNSAAKKLKKYYASPLCLIAFVFACGCFLTSIMTTIMGAMGATNSLLSRIDDYAYLPEGFSYSQFAGTNTIIADIFGCLTIGLLAAAVGLIYFMSKHDKSPSAGFTIIHIYGIIGIIFSVLLGLLLVLLLILGIILMASGGLLTNMLGSLDLGSIYKDTAFDSGEYYGHDIGSYFFGMFTVAFIVVLFILLVVFVLCLMYFINMTRYSSSMKKGLREPYLHVKGAGFFGVFFIIMGAFMIIGALNSVSLFAYDPALAIISIIEILCYAGMYISFGILAAGFKKYAVAVNKELEAQYNSYARGF